MTNQQLLAKLTELDACRDAIKWVGDRDLKTAWSECERPDWMLWFAVMMAGKRGWANPKAVILNLIKASKGSLVYAKQYKKPLREVYDAAERYVHHPTASNYFSVLREEEVALQISKEAGPITWGAGAAARAAWFTAGTARQLNWKSTVFSPRMLANAAAVAALEVDAAAAVHWPDKGVPSDEAFALAERAQQKMCAMMRKQLWNLCPENRKTKKT